MTGLITARTRAAIARRPFRNNTKNYSAFEKPEKPAQIQVLAGDPVRPLPLLPTPTVQPVVPPRAETAPATGNMPRKNTPIVRSAEVKIIISRRLKNGLLRLPEMPLLLGGQIQL